MAISRPQVRHGALDSAYAENDPPVVVCDSIEVTDRDSTVLVGAVVRIARGYDAGHDILSYTGGPAGISAAWDALTGTLTFTGTASLADYQSALRLVTFEYIGADPASG